MAQHTSLSPNMLMKCFLLLVLTASANSSSGLTDQKQNYLVKAAGLLQRSQMNDSVRREELKQHKHLLNTVVGSFNPNTFLEEAKTQAEADLDSGLTALSNDSYDVSPTCLNHTEIFLGALIGGQQWALKMIDAMGKPPSDILGLNIVWLGSYDECVSIEASLQEDSRSHVFSGQYCKTSVQLSSQASIASPAGLAITIGLCVPNSCSDSDVTALVNTGIYALPINTSSLPGVTAVCQKESLEFDTKAIATIIVCTIFAIVMVAATAYDLLFFQYDIFNRHQSDQKYKRLPDVEDASETQTKQDTVNLSEKTPLHHANGYHAKYNGTTKTTGDSKMATSQPGTLGKVLLSFSMFTNAKKILNTSQPSGTLSAINGIRFISMSWVILGHTYAFGLSYGENVAEFYPRMLNRFSFQAISNATVSVDSFFVLSGLLVAYLALKQLKKSDGAAQFGWGMYYFHRFWRLTPPYMLFLMLYVSTIKYWSNGPLWSQSGVDVNECRDDWWQNLLYINNLYNSESFCMVWSWYLSNDMQFFVLSPLMLIPLYYSTLLGSLVCLGFILICFITSGAIASANNYTANFLFDATGGYMKDIYFKPYTRIGPYVVGIVAGYLLYITECKIRIPKLLNILGWAVATGTALSVVYGLYDIDGNNVVNNLSTGVSAFYIAVSRTAWAIAVAWVIVACATGNGGFVNTLLSWSPFVPLGRLTYCAYLVHPVVMYVVYMNRSTLIHFDDLEAIYLFLGHMCIAYMAAFVISLAFESPMMGLEKALLGRGKNS